MANATTKKTDARVELFKKALQFFEQKSVELEIPFLADGAQVQASESVDHNLGYKPLVIAFITFPSVQADNSDYTRFFGGSVVNNGGIGGSSINISFLSEEEVISTEQDIIFSVTQSSKLGFAQPGVTATIDYFILTRPTPPTTT